MLLINFKSSKEGTGPGAVRLAAIIEELSRDLITPVIPVVHELDTYSVRKVYEGEMWIQHADAEENTTGRTSVSVLGNHNELKIGGVFLNHSEHKYHKFEALKKTIKDCENYGIRSLVFANDMEELEKVSKLKPDFVAYEPPELVGSKTTSVAKAKPESIKDSFKITKKHNVPLIVGAGVKDKKDVVTSLKFGAVGVAVSTAVVKAKDPEKVLKDILSGFKAK